MSLDAIWTLDWARRATELIAESHVELTRLDRTIGDADHGNNLERGMKAAVSELDAVQQAGGVPASPGEVLKLVAIILMATVGGVGGPSLGTAFLKAIRSCEAAIRRPGDLAHALEEATSGLKARGHAASGDKITADAWYPTAVAVKEATENGQDEIGVFAAATQVVTTGVQKTEPLQARRGQASFLGERSYGHRDPGAQSSAFILQATLDAIRDHVADPILVVEQA